MTNTEFLHWLQQRLINVYGEDENRDFVLKTDEIASEVERLERERDEARAVLNAGAKVLAGSQARVAALTTALAGFMDAIWEMRPNEWTPDGLVRTDWLRALLREVEDNDEARRLLAEPDPDAFSTCLSESRRLLDRLRSAFADAKEFALLASPEPAAPTASEPDAPTGGAE